MSRGASRILNQLTVLLLGMTVMLTLVYTLIFLFPQLPINPFRPPQVAGDSSTPTPVSNITLTPRETRPPTWTPTATPGPTDTPGPTATPTETATPGPTRPPVATRTHTPTPTLPGPTFSPFKYTKTNDPITFRSDLYGAACGSWLGVAGKVLDRNGDPLTGISVVGWGGPVPEQNKRVFVSGSSVRLNTLYGSPAAYEIFIGAPGDFDFYIQVYENGQPVSAAISLRTRSDCRADLALVDLQRNH